MDDNGRPAVVSPKASNRNFQGAVTPKASNRNFQGVVTPKASGTKAGHQDGGNSHVSGLFDNDSLLSVYSRPSGAILGLDTHLDGTRIRKVFKNNASIKQERLPACIQKPRWRRIGFYFILHGICLIIIGILGFTFFYYNSNIIDYTNCEAYNLNSSNHSTCAQILQNNSFLDRRPCKCRIKVTLHDDFEGRVYMSYILSNFYSNQRQFVTSIDYQQIKGEIFTSSGDPQTPRSKCGQYSSRKVDNNKKYVYPCGLLSNAYFSDTIRLFRENGEEIKFKPVPARGSKVINDPIYKRPKDVSYDSAIFKKHFTRPSSWSDEFYREFWKDGGVENEHYKVWARVAPFSEAVHPYKYFDDKLEGCHLNRGFCKGTYFVEIDYRFNSISYHGRKYIEISSAISFSYAELFTRIACIILGAFSIVLFGISVGICIHRRIKVSKLRKLREREALKSDPP